MQKESYSFSEFNFSSKLIRNLVEEQDNVKSFVDSFFSEKSIINQIKEKDFTAIQRDSLVDALTTQNAQVELTSLTKNNIKSLESPNTFTITTGHQLNLLTGPLYSIYKILQILVITERLNKKEGQYKFVPVFWMASEDHDFEEINHINLFGTQIEWAKAEQDNYIAGKINTTHANFEEFEAGVLNKFSDDSLKLKVKKFLNHYKLGSLASSTRSLLNELFGEFGLVIIDGDDKDLKKQFQPIAQQEIENQVVFNTVNETNQKLEVKGYHNQVFLRECNLFYIENSTTRYRIAKTENGFEINEKIFSKNELLKLLKAHPERFSPNALMRPLYQETILPNLCYVGGGGEIAYWLQLKDVFNKIGLKFPLLRVRDSYILLNDKHRSTIDEIGFSVLELKQHFDELSKQFVKLNSGNDLTLTDEFELFEKLKTSLTNKFSSTDLGVQRFVEGEVVRMQSQLDKIEKKLIQSEKKSQETSLKKIKRLQNLIYPNNGFQERHENILQYISNNNFISDLKKEVEQSMTEQPQIKIFNI